MLVEPVADALGMETVLAWQKQRSVSVVEIFQADGARCFSRSVQGLDILVLRDWEPLEALAG